jgi:hypothetical protein
MHDGLSACAAEDVCVYLLCMYVCTYHTVYILGRFLQNLCFIKESEFFSLLLNEVIMGYMELK